MSITTARRTLALDATRRNRWFDRLVNFCATASLSAALVSTPSNADEWTRTLGLTGAFSDNVDRASTSPRSDVAYIGEVGLRYRRETLRTTADIDANYRYLGYARDTFGR